MIYVNEKLRYMFDAVPVLVADDEDTGKEIKMGKLIYVYHGKDADKIKRISDEGWDVAYKNGNFRDNRSDNLELVIFKDDKFFKDNEDLEKQMLCAKRNAEEKEELAKRVLSEKTVDKFKIDSLTKQVVYEQNRVKELNKELNEKEKEIRRLIDIINSINKCRL